MQQSDAPKGRIHSIETMGLLDGPGIRTIFFLQGCPLRCAFCHNPDSQALDGGTEMTPREVLEKARKYRSYHGAEGGVTFSGGEPLLQGEFLAECLRLLKNDGFNTCVDTSAFGNPHYYKEIFPNVDTILLDIKAFDDETFQNLVEGPMATLLEFMNDLPENGFRGQIWIRHVMLPGWSDSEEAMDRLVETIRPVAEYVDRIEILPYHVMGIEKYRSLGREYRLEGLPPMDKARAKELMAYANHRFALKRSEWRIERRESDLGNTKGAAGRRYLSRDEVRAMWPTLSGIPLIHDIEAEGLSEVIDNLQFFELDKGSYVFRSGDPAEYMYIICKGHMKIYYNTVDGREQIYYLYQEGDFVGGHNILEDTSYLYMGRALDQCLIAGISKELFNRCLMNNVKIMHRILKKSFERIRWAEELIQRLTTSNSTMKVADLLIRLTETFGQQQDDGSILIELSMNREEMGSFSGMTRETITRKLGEFKDLGYIDYVGNKGLVIRDLKALRAYCF